MPKIASILACGLAVSLFSFSAEAVPSLRAAAHVAAPEALLVRDFCGLGFHRNPWGACVPNGVPYGYVAPVVVAPYAAPVMVAPPIVCPYGYYYYVPYNRCVPTP